MTKQGSTIVIYPDPSPRPLMPSVTPDQTTQKSGSIIVLGTNGQVQAGSPCTAPVRPVGNSDPIAISSYEAARDKFMRCEEHRPPTDAKSQQDLDQSLAAIGEDQNRSTAIIQQEVVGGLPYRNR